MVAGLSPARVDAFVKDCHQAIATEALDTAPWPLGLVSPRLTTHQLTLFNELSINVAPRVKGFWQLSVLVGNQFTDGGSLDAKDIIALAELTARPDLQHPHCLRAGEDDGSEGDRRALGGCKAFILEQVGAALGEGDAPDLDATETVRLHLVFSGAAAVPLERFGFHMGQATHAVQDAFTHMFRSPDLLKVRSVLNWVDWLHEGQYEPARDGFRHLLAMDQCGPSDEGGPARRAAALRATSELLAAVANDEGGRAGRLARAGAVVDAWFGIDELCTAENHWCDAPEQNLVTAAGCALAAAPGPRRVGETWEVGMMILAMATAAGWAFVSRRARRVLVLAFMIGAASAAHAEEADPSRGEHKGGVVAKATPEEQKALESHPFGVLATGGFSIDNGGYNVGVGARYDITKRFTAGLNVNYSPWISFETGRTTRGTTDVFAVGIYRLDVRDYLELRFTLAAGASVLMFDSWAAKKGTVGPYFAISPLGVAIRMSSHLRLLVDPAELVVAIPQTTGIPLAYRQHRFSIAVQANF